MLQKIQNKRMSVGRVFQNHHGALLRKEDGVSGLAYSISVLIVQFYKYSAYLLDTVFLKISFSLHRQSQTLELKYSLSNDQTFISVCRKAEKDLSLILDRHFTIHNINLDIEWVTNEAGSTTYRCRINSSLSRHLSNIRFYCSPLAFFNPVFKKAELHYKSLAAQALSSPLSRLKDLNCLTNVEFKEIESLAYGPIDERISRPQLLHNLFKQTVLSFPGRSAVVYHKNVLAYDELNRRANRLANFLIHQGVEPGDFIGLLLQRTPEVYISMLGVLKAGAAYVPLDPESPEERINYI